MNKRLISFYKNEQVYNLTFDQVLNQNDDWFEECHNFIQVIFPLEKASAFNKDAPLLDRETIELFRTDLELIRNFEKASKRFLKFLGLSFENDNIQILPNLDKQLYTWAEFNHNSLRITRFLASATILGQEKLAQKLFDFLNKLICSTENKRLTTSLSYWQDALNGINRKM